MRPLCLESPRETPMHRPTSSPRRVPGPCCEVQDRLETLPEGPDLTGHKGEQTNEADLPADRDQPCRDGAALHRGERARAGPLDDGGGHQLRLAARHVGDLWI